MATLLIAEFAQLGHPGPIPKAPPIAEQVVTYTTSVASAAFQERTSHVRIKALDAPAYLEFGTAPTAAATNAIHLAVGETEYYGVPTGESYKVAAYDGTS